MPGVEITVQGPYIITIDDDNDAGTLNMFQVQRGNTVQPLVLPLFSVDENGKVVTYGPLRCAGPLVFKNTGSGPPVTFRNATTEVASFTTLGGGNFRAIRLPSTATAPGFCPAYRCADVVPVVNQQLGSVTLVIASDVMRTTLAFTAI